MGQIHSRRAGTRLIHATVMATDPGAYAISDADSNATHDGIPPTTPSPAIAVAAVLVGLIVGTMVIANTSIGWHLATGDWILAQRAVPRTDPFSLTSGGAPWIDHEWLFQVVVTIAEEVGGGVLLTLVRSVVVTGLAVLLVTIGTRSGMSPAAALVLATISLCGARQRFLLRPELVTLLVVPSSIWLFLTRDRDRTVVRLGAFALLVVVGVNMHGGALVVPILAGGAYAGQLASMILRRMWQPKVVGSGAVGVAIALAAPLLNPYGWHLYEVPLRLARLVEMPHIPNLEWVSPSVATAPVFFVGIAAAVLVLGARERRLDRWILLAAASSLALHHGRNIGLFFVLLPVIVAPALATFRAFAPTPRGTPRRPVLRASAIALSFTLAATAALAPWPAFGLGFADNYFPSRACDFLDRYQLPESELYNDVRFGGYLIHRRFPGSLTFQDDRNEIHEPLLRKIWSVLQSSNPAAWRDLLTGYGVDTALVRYHPMFTVSGAGGGDLGRRGFSALWFPRRDWALIYWDDIAMVFILRETMISRGLEDLEYATIRPDDVDEIRRRLANDAGFRAAIASDLDRKLQEDPSCLRARVIASWCD